MPIYSYKCEKCEIIKDMYNSINDRRKPLKCDCGGDMLLSIQPTMLQPVLGGGDFPGYKCVVTDKFVSSRKQRREIMKEHDLIERG